MDDKWQFNRFRERLAVLAMVVACLLVLNLGFCWSLNDEGLVLLGFRERVVSDPFGALSNWNDDGDIDPCSWNGVECSDGKVVVLNLKDLCLGGTLAPELKNLVHIKSIMLRNNSFEGVIPEGFGKLEELEVLDLGYNNFSGPLPADLGSNLSLTILLLDNNGLLGSLSPEIYILEILSEFQVDESLLSSVAKDVSCSKIPIARKFTQTEDFVRRKLQQANRVAPFNRNNQVNGSNTLTASEAPSPEASIAPRESLPPSPSPSPSLSPSPSASPEMPRVISSPDSSSGPPPEPPLVTPSPLPSTASSKNNRAAILAGSIGGGIFLIILVIGIYLYMNNNVATVRPWATGLSGQLQKAFVTGVPKLKRSELVTACEDFSNVIGTSPIGTVYKGTLSNGVEIAVASVVATSSKDWSRNLEVQFRKKIDTLSKLNHKNFVNLIGYCVEEEPFTRMLVFEYAPNGTLFEHLHIKESEHLDWIMRVRIAMGMAYCLEHMHQLQPPITHNNLNSSAIRLTEDYAAKVSELSFWNKIAAADGGSPRKKLWKTPSTTSLESNVYCFGVILFEMVTGRLPYSVDNGSFDDWASDYVRGNQPLKEMVDPTLTSFLEEELEQLGEVIKFCVHPDPKQRPTMRQVSTRLREISGISPDGATPKLSPLWWAELELMSTEAI